MSSRHSAESVALPAVWAGSEDLPVAVVEDVEPAPCEDAELIARLQARDFSNLDLLFHRYSRLVLGTACRVLGNPSEAEEVVQDVFFYLCKKSQLFNPAKGTFKAWIVQITFCRALDRKSYLARHGFYTGEDIDSLQLRGETDLEQELDAKLSRKHLEKAFTELTDMQRRTINYFYFEGLDLREISERLSEPLDHVRHHLYRGLERLRRSSLLDMLRRK